MTPLLNKLNFRQQEAILLLNAPDSFRPEKEAMRDCTRVYEHADELSAATFIMAFVSRKEQLDRLIPLCHRLLQGDGLLWFCYPKKSSKRYTCEFNRDTGWELLGQHGFEAVRQVSVDEDWTALRFRRIEYIRQMTRRKSMAITAKGKRRTSGE